MTSSHAPFDNHPFQLHSPWTIDFSWEQKDREIAKTADVGIIGGGISGVMQAFFILRDTDRKVALYEEGKIGGGATGNNASHLTPTLEKSFQDFEKAAATKTSDPEERKRLAGDVFRASFHGYSLYEQFLTEIPELEGFPVFKVNAFDAIPKDSLQMYLDDLQAQESQGVRFAKMLIADGTLAEMPWIQEYEKIYEVIPKERLRKLLKTKNDLFPAAIEAPSMIMNSSEFVNRIVAHLKKNYPDRFHAYENVQITNIAIDEDKVNLSTKTQTIQAENVILCTNGYTSIDVHDSINPTNDKMLNVLRPNFGAMVGYIVKSGDGDDREPAAIAYKSIDNYPFMRCFPIVFNGNECMLYAFGGPTEKTENFHESEAQALKTMLPDIVSWISTNLDIPIDTDMLLNPSYEWVGRMMYATDGLRRSGRAPKNSRFWLNLACNGIGLALAAGTAERNVQLMLGNDVAPSLFDPN